MLYQRQKIVKLFFFMSQQYRNWDFSTKEVKAPYLQATQGVLNQFDIDIWPMLSRTDQYHTLLCYKILRESNGRALYRRSYWTIKTGIWVLCLAERVKGRSVFFLSFKTLIEIEDWEMIIMTLYSLPNQTGVET